MDGLTNFGRPGLPHAADLSVRREGLLQLLLHKPKNRDTQADTEGPLVRLLKNPAHVAVSQGRSGFGDFRDPKGSCLESSSTGRPRLLLGTGLTSTQIPVIEIDSKSTKEGESNLDNFFGTMAHWDENVGALDTLEDHKGAEASNSAEAAPFPPLPPPLMKAEEDKGPWWSQLLSSPVKKLKLRDWSMNFYSKVVPKLELPPSREVHHGDGKDDRIKREPKRNRRRDLPKRRSANNTPKPTLQWAVKLAKSKNAIRDVVKRVEDDFYANSSRASKNSKRNTLAELLKAGGEGFPLTPYALKLIVGTLREAGYKSTSAYLVEAKLEHVENGHAWSNNLERHFKLCMTAAKRGTGPRKKAVEVPEDTWSSHSLLEDPVQKGMKVCFSALLFACGTHWMMREIELANLVSKDVCFEPKGRLVSITWNESKTDKEGRGIRRTLQCLCEDNCDLKCPYAVLEVLVNRAALKGAPGGHLAIDHKGRPASKADIVKDWKRLYGDDTTGHSTRRSGALQYIRKGWPVAQVGYLGRWKSNIIMEYAQEALEAMAINSSNHFGMEDSQFNLAQKLISSHAAPTDLSKDIEAKADREVVAKLQDDISKFKAATKDSNKSLESAIADLDERMKPTAPFLPFLVISAKQQVIHQNAKLLAFAPPRSWKTRCGWYYYASNYEFADGDDTMVTCIKCQQCWSVRACAVRTLHLIGPPAVPVLTSRLEDENAEMRAACLEGLGHLGEMASSSAAKIVSCLADQEEIVLAQTFQTVKKIGTAGPEELATCIQSTTKPQVQLRAVQALGEFGKAVSAYAPVIAGLLGCGVKNLEEAAVNALKCMGLPAAVAVTPILVHRTPPVHDPDNMDDEEMQDAQKQRRLSAASALRTFGEEISAGQAQLVGSCLLDPDPQIRKEAVETLKILGESGAATFGAYTDPAVGTKLDARVLAMEALGKLGLFALPWIPQLAKCLEDPAAEVRRVAAVALGELAEEHSAAVADFVQEIAACLHDGDALTRRRSIECLGKLGNKAKPFVEDMVHILEGIDSWNWVPVAEALSRLGAATPAHADILAGNLTHDSRSVRWSAASSLGKLGEMAKDHVDALVNLLQSEDASLRCVGTQSLMQVAKGVNLEDKFLPLLMDPDTNTREQACLALASHCDGEGLEKLLMKLHDPKPFVRRAAAATLAELGQDAADCAGDVLKLLFDSNSYVCATAARALVAFGAEGAKTLMDRLLDEEEDDQLDVESSVLQRIMLDAMQAADAEFIEPYLHVLVVFLAANQPEIRLAAWSCLSKVSDKGFQSLVKGARDSHIVVRKGVAEAIAFLLSGREQSGDPTFMEREATETLAQQLTDPSDAVRVQAAEAFRRIGGPLAEAHSEALANRLQEHDIRVYCPVMDTLGAMGKAAAPYIALLKARLEVPEVKVRASAVRALGGIGEPAMPSASLLVLRLEEDSNVEVKLCAVEALGEIGSASVQAAGQIAKVHVNCLASHMIMDEACLRRACARTLGRLGPHASSCLHELVLALGDSDLEVRKEAANALTGIGENAAPEIVAIIRSVEDTVDLHLA
eukprot:s422_g13.t1